MKLNLSVGVVDIKTPEEIRTMRIGGLIWQAIRNYLLDTVTAGMTLKEVEKLVKKQFEKYGVESSLIKKEVFPL